MHFVCANILRTRGHYRTHYKLTFTVLCACVYNVSLGYCSNCETPSYIDVHSPFLFIENTHIDPVTVNCNVHTQKYMQ